MTWAFRIPTFFSRALSLPSESSSQDSSLADTGSSVMRSLQSLPHRTPLLSEQIKNLKLKPNAPYSLQKQKQMLAPRLVKPVTKES